MVLWTRDRSPNRTITLGIDVLVQTLSARYRWFSGQEEGRRRMTITGLIISLVIGAVAG